MGAGAAAPGGFRVDRAGPPAAVAVSACRLNQYPVAVVLIMGAFLLAAGGGAVACYYGKILVAGDGFDRSPRRRELSHGSPAGARWRRHARACARPRALGDFLGAAVAAGSVGRDGGRAVPGVLLARAVALAAAD